MWQKKRISIFLLLLFAITTFVTPQILQADSSKRIWGFEAKPVVSEYNFPYADGYLATAVGAVRQPTPDNGVSLQKITIASPFFSHPINTNIIGRTRISTYFQKNTDGALRKSSLIVIFPGIFSALTSDRLAYYMDYFAKRGFHVVSISNSFSSSYQADFPNARPGDLAEEAKAALYNVDWVQTFLRKQNALGKTHVFSWSYGSFLASVTASMDQEQKRQFDGTLTLVGPPLDLVKAIQNIDSTMDQYADWAADRSYLSRLMSLAALYGYSTSQDQLTKEQIAMAKPFVIYGGFNYPLQESMFFISKHWLPSFFPKLSEIGIKSYMLFSNQLRFRKYFQTFAPDVFAKYTQDGQSKLVYWLKKITYKRGPQIRLISAKDDFLNNVEDWKSLQRHVILLPTGGHCGYMGTPWFNKTFLPSVFFE